MTIYCGYPINKHLFFYFCLLYIENVNKTRGGICLFHSEIGLMCRSGVYVQLGVFLGINVQSLSVGFISKRPYSLLFFVCPN